MNDPWTWTTDWGMTGRASSGLDWWRAKGENWDNCNRITIKYLIKKEVRVKICLMSRCGNSTPEGQTPPNMNISTPTHTLPPVCHFYAEKK